MLLPQSAIVLLICNEEPYAVVPNVVGLGTIVLLSRIPYLENDRRVEQILIPKQDIKPTLLEFACISVSTFGISTLPDNGVAYDSPTPLTFTTTVVK